MYYMQGAFRKKIRLTLNVMLMYNIRCVPKNIPDIICRNLNEDR